MTGPPAFAADLDLALAMADIADGVLRSSIPGLVNIKPDGSLVTSVDFAIERALRDVLTDQRPADVALAEELGAGESQDADASPRRRWTIDPLDHTAAFVRGAPEFATVIALLIDEEPVVGVVTAPAMGRRWWAAQGLGAFRDDGSISVSAVDVLAAAAVSIGHFHEWQERDLLGGALVPSRAAKYSYGLGGRLTTGSSLAANSRLHTETLGFLLGRGEP